MSLREISRDPLIFQAQEEASGDGSCRRPTKISQDDDKCASLQDMAKAFGRVMDVVVV